MQLTLEGGDTERFCRNVTLTKLYADGAKLIVLRPSAENPDRLCVWASVSQLWRPAEYLQ